MQRRKLCVTLGCLLAAGSVFACDSGVQVMGDAMVDSGQWLADAMMDAGDA